MGYDCVMIPGASKITVDLNPAPNSLCGNNKGLVTAAAGTTSTTVCSKLLSLTLSLLLLMLLLLLLLLLTPSLSSLL